MKHLTEEQLIDLYYSEDGPESARHLDSCAECARAYEALQSDLADMHPLEPPARPAEYGEQVWHAIASAVPTMHASSRRRWQPHGLWIGLCSAAACTLLVAAAFFAGRLWEHRQPQPLVANRPAAPVPEPRVVVVVLSDHLDRSERFLVELKHARADDTELASPLREEARSLLAANRKVRADTAQAGDPALTAALDHLNELLDAMASHPGGLNAAAIARLQDEMNSDGLLFEVRVLRSRIPRGKSAMAAHLKEGGIA